jgi:hypothetical protein
MASPFPIQNTPTFDEDEIPIEYDSSDDDIPIPTLDLNGSDSSDIEVDDDDDDDDEISADIPAPQFSELATLTGVKRTGTAFPGSSPFVTTAPQQVTFSGVMNTSIPSPFSGIKQSTVSLAPTPQASVLRLAVMPQTAMPFPGQVKSTVPGVPTIPGVPQPTTVPGIPQTNPGPGIPQVTGLTLVPKPTVPTITQLSGLTMAPKTSPTVPVLAGLAPKSPLIPVVQPKTAAPAVDVEALLAKMPGITVLGVSQTQGQVPANVEDLLIKESDETSEDFEARKQLTMKLASIPDYKLNNATAATVAHMMMKKTKLGVTYDHDIESALTYLTGLLQR